MVEVVPERRGGGQQGRVDGGTVFFLFRGTIPGENVVIGRIKRGHRGLVCGVGKRYWEDPMPEEV